MEMPPARLYQARKGVWVSFQESWKSLERFYKDVTDSINVLKRYSILPAENRLEVEKSGPGRLVREVLQSRGLVTIQIKVITQLCEQVTLSILEWEVAV